MHPPKIAKGQIFDLSTKERYVLHRISNATGSFVSRVRKEYESVLDSIAKNCCEPHIFKSKNAGYSSNQVGGVNKFCCGIMLYGA
ncbi:MAG: hypothetical protein LBQ98_09010 [Nitrososphaerota archaeon]|nr:hypothetical protein [Nitrososphaerota archaeon]